MFDFEETLARGGTGRLDFLRYCVLSINMDPLFIFVAGEYRLRPTHAGALALFDMFCATDAPARLRAYDLLPPRELALADEIRRIRQRWAAMQQPVPQPDEADGESVRRVPAGPGRTLFDALVQGLRNDPQRKLEAIRTSYDPQLTAHENLPGGRLSAVQRNFLDHVWLPIVRPRLTAAGFWPIAAIG